MTKRAKAGKDAVRKPTTKPEHKPTTQPIAKQLPNGTPAPRTASLPEHVTGTWALGPGTVTALAVGGHDRIYDLPRTQPVSTIGSQGDQDVVLTEPVVSRKHCVIERRGLRTHVVDVGSKYGIVVGDQQEKEFELKPGARFKLGGRLTVVALNDEMRTHLPTAGQLVCRESERGEKGSQERLSPIDVLAIALDRAPVLITGEEGCDHDRLARAIHGMSPRRVHDLIHATAIPADRSGQRKLIDAASRSTLVLTIDDAMEPFDDTFVSMLFDTSYNVRVIALASSKTRAAKVLGAETISKMTEIYLRSIAFRPSAILWLLDEMLHERGTSLRTSDLTEPNRHALEHADWRRNFEELRQVADWLIVLDRSESLRAAAEELGVARATFHDWLSKVGITVPLTRDERVLARR